VIYHFLPFSIWYFVFKGEEMINHGRAQAGPYGSWSNELESMPQGMPLLSIVFPARMENLVCMHSV
jgi:hypothetical protein